MNLNVIEGVVVDTSDPQQMGRIKVWCPSIDGEGYKVDLLPWADYVTPLGGQTRDYPAGSSGKITRGLVSYGFWAIPKVGAQVIVALLYGDTNQRVYLGSVFGTHGNRSLPVGRNRPDFGKAPVSDTFDPVEPQTSHLNTQFGGNLDSSQAKTRGAYERQVAQDQNDKDGKEGYAKGVVEDGLDPQTYCLTTPGRHSIIFQDNPEVSRVRVKSADGHQVILDDANERIYISTAKGNTWIELDSDGHVHVYGAESVSVAAGKDLNLSAKGNVNIASGGDMNLSAGGKALLSACANLELNGGGVVNITSGAALNMLASGMLIASASAIHLNGSSAPSADCATQPTIVPNHEPWDRPATTGSRGPHWKA